MPVIDSIERDSICITAHLTQFSSKIILIQHLSKVDIPKVVSTRNRHFICHLAIVILPRVTCHQLLILLDLHIHSNFRGGVGINCYYHTCEVESICLHSLFLISQLDVSFLHAKERKS